MSCQLILSLAYVVHMDTKSSMCNFLHSCEETFRVGLLPCFQAKQIPTHISQLSQKCTLDRNVPSVKFLNIKGSFTNSIHKHVKLFPFGLYISTRMMIKLLLFSQYVSPHPHNLDTIPFCFIIPKILYSSMDATFGLVGPLSF